MNERVIRQHRRRMNSAARKYAKLTIDRHSDAPKPDRSVLVQTIRFWLSQRVIHGYALLLAAALAVSIYAQCGCAVERAQDPGSNGRGPRIDASESMDGVEDAVDGTASPPSDLRPLTDAVSRADYLEKLCPVATEIRICATSDLAGRRYAFCASEKLISIEDCLLTFATETIHCLDSCPP